MAQELTDSDLITITRNYRQESNQARFNRIEQNRLNFDAYHLRQDFGYKQKGQSREFLPKMAMAVEQNSMFIQEGLVGIGDWFDVEPQPGIPEDLMMIKPSEVYKMLDASLKQINIVTKVSNGVKLGMIGSLMIAKVHGYYEVKPKYKAETTVKDGKYIKQLLKINDKTWCLEISLIRQEDFYPDPANKKLYELEDIYMDYYEIQRLADEGKYDKEAVKNLKGQGSNIPYDREYNKNRETDQNSTNHFFRNQVKVTECWGNIINSEGELIAENVMWTIGNDNYVLQKPTANPYWHQESPYVVSPILEVPGSPWGRAVMDAPTMLNRAINEFFNLILDGGLMSVHGIKQIRTHWLDNPEQVEDGIAAGITLSVNPSCPPGAQVLERVDTASIPQDALPVFNLLQQEFFTSAMTNDLRMGAQPYREVKATAIVESSQTITSMFSGMAKHIEERWITPLLTKAWMTQAQYMKEIDLESIKALLGSARAEQLKGLSNEELFADTVNGCKFRVFGISATLAKQKDFTKLTSLLQTVASSPMIMEEFVKGGYSFGKLLKEIMVALDIKDWKLKQDQTPVAMQPQGQAQVAPGADIANSQSQIPQAGAAGNQGDLSPIPTNSFPGSRANVPLTTNLGT